MFSMFYVNKISAHVIRKYFSFNLIFFQFLKTSQHFRNPGFKDTFLETCFDDKLIYILDALNCQET